MSLWLYGEFPSSEIYQIGYLAFYRFRCRLAELISNDYKKWYQKVTHPYESVDLEPHEISTEFAPLNKFLFMSDCDGDMTYTECKALYDCISSLNDDEIYGVNMSVNNFKQLLQDCYKYKVNLTWH